MSKAKNPHEENSPEWQLWESMTSAEALVVTYTGDIERYEQKRAAARLKAERYREALGKLA